MRRKAIPIFLLSILLLFRLNLPVVACCEGSPPGDPSCYQCQGGVWVLKPSANCGTNSDCSACYGCVSCNCQCVAEVLGVGSLLYDSSCVNCYIPFIAVPNEQQYCGCVHWSGGGDPASQDGGCVFNTRWDTPGIKTVTASTCKNSKSMQVTIAAPTNFHLVRWWDNYGQLVMYYEWDSTSGDRNHLHNCTVGERVDYSGPNPFFWPSPWQDSSENPETTEGGAWAGSATDTHKPGNITKPYHGAGFTCYQKYQYRACTGPYSTLLGPHPIDRSVYSFYLCQSGWRYEITKTGAWSAMCLPP